MQKMSCPRPLHRNVSVPAGLAAALMLALWLPAQAAPAEGTSGQTVTGRSINRHDSTVRSASRGTAVAAAPIQGKPAWKDLTSAQRQALQPLSPHWDRLTEQHKLKWLALSKNYPSLSSEEQLKLHLRMSKWANLSQKQRIQARQNFQDIKKLTPEQKASEWEAYQALSPDEKRRLARQARPQPAGVTTVTPGTSHRLSPAPRKSVVPRPSLAEATFPLQQNTLLPRPEAAGSPPERSPYEDEPAEAQ